MRSFVNDGTRMVGHIIADRAIVMGRSIRMVVKCKSHEGEKKTNEER